MLAEIVVALLIAIVGAGFTWFFGGLAKARERGPAAVDREARRNQLQEEILSDVLSICSAAWHKLHFETRSASASSVVVRAGALASDLESPRWVNFGAEFRQTGSAARLVDELEKFYRGLASVSDRLRQVTAGPVGPSVFDNGRFDLGGLVADGALAVRNHGTGVQRAGAVRLLSEIDAAGTSARATLESLGLLDPLRVDGPTNVQKA